MTGIPLLLFLALHLSTVVAMGVLHLSRSRLSLAPMFAGCAILSYLIWQLLQTGWWVELGSTHIDAALYGPLPAILGGLTLVYAMDGLRAARAYVLTMTMSALLSILFLQYIAELGEHVPIASFFLFPLSVHLVLAGSLILAAAVEAPVYELARRVLPTGPAMATALATGMATFLVTHSLLVYGPTTGLLNIFSELDDIAVVLLVPMLLLCLYGWLAQRSRLVLPARKLSAIFTGWRRVEEEMRDMREGFLKARETISELRELNDALETEQRLRADQVHNSPQAILEVNRKGHVTVFNPAAQALFEQTLSAGLAIDAILPGFFPVRAPQGAASRVLSLPRAEGLPKRRLQVTVLPAHHPHYGPAFTLLAEDVTEREQEAFTRTVTERVRGIQMTGQVISHDFANIMLGIEGNLERIRTRLDGDPTARAAVEPSLKAIRDAAQRLREMMTQLGSQQPFALPELKTHDPLVLVNEAVSLQHPGAEKAGIALTVEGHPDILVAADRTQIVRVLMNLIGNALRACKKGGHIRVVLAAGPDGAEIAVEDDGIGMSAEQLGRAFEPGFSTKGNGQGGLGLAISYLIVDAHGGRLVLVSRQGHGTVATIFLPPAVTETVPAEAGPLLIATPDEHRRGQLAKWLLSQGGEAVEVGCAAELAAILEDEPATWELVIRSIDFPICAALRQRLKACPQLLIGSRRAVLLGYKGRHLSPALIRRILALANGDGNDGDKFERIRI